MEKAHECVTKVEQMATSMKRFENTYAPDDLETYILCVPSGSSLIDQHQFSGYLPGQKDCAYFSGSESGSLPSFFQSGQIIYGTELDPIGLGDLPRSGQTGTRDGNFGVHFSRNEHVTVKLRKQFKAIDPGQHDEGRCVGNNFHKPRRSMVCQSSRRSSSP